MHLSSVIFIQPLHFWINELLMSVFFLLAGLEIKRELRLGELKRLSDAMLPVAAAIGGMIVPALIFYFINRHSADRHAWGIPMATDIAFSLAILSLLGKRIPLSLKIFLTTLALVDDMGAILVIAVFYTSQLNAVYLLAMAITLAFLLAMNLTGVKTLFLYILPGLLLWFFTYRAGIHPTIAGVLLALIIPDNKTENSSPLKKLEHLLSRPVAFIIMPLFALSNTAISFGSIHLNDLIKPLSLGIMLGLLLGKPLGIVGASLLSIKLSRAQQPDSFNLKQLTGIGLLGGVGFTMSVFISLICYREGHTQDLNTFSIILASLLSGVTGFILLNYAYPKNVVN